MTAYDQTLAHHPPFPPKPNQTKSRPIGDGYMNLFSIQSLSKALGSVLSEKPISLSTIASKVDQKNTDKRNKIQITTTKLSKKVEEPL